MRRPWGPTNGEPMQSLEALGLVCSTGVKRPLCRCSSCQCEELLEHVALMLEQLAPNADLDDLFLLGLGLPEGWEVRPRCWSALEREMPDQVEALRAQLGPLEGKVGFFLCLPGGQCFSGTLRRPDVSRTNAVSLS